ncbi:hypothetical protein EJB05_50701, partial [Eragrostis curvula]
MRSVSSPPNPVSMAAAVEVPAVNRVMETVRWFNATKGSGFVTPEIGGEYLHFHQPSLKSDGVRILNVRDSVEFEVRADNYGSPKTFDITAPDCRAAGCFCPNGSDHGGGNGCYGSELAGGFHVDGGDRGHGGMLYGVDGNRDCGVGGGYGISSGHGCHSHEQGALLVLSEGSALQVFDEMPLGNVIWDDDKSTDCNSHDPLRHLEDCLVTEARERIAEPFTEDILNQATTVPTKVEFMDPELVMAPIQLEGPAGEVFEKIPVMDVVWDEELLQDLDLHDGLLRQLAQGGELMGGQQNVMGNSFPPSFLCDLIPGDDNLTLLSKGSAMCSAHQERKPLAESDLNIKPTNVRDVLSLLDTSTTPVEGLLDEMPCKGGTEQIKIMSPAASDGAICVMLEKMPSVNVVLDEDSIDDMDTNDGLLQKITTESECGY